MTEYVNPYNVPSKPSIIRISFRFHRDQKAHPFSRLNFQINNTCRCRTIKYYLILFSWSYHQLLEHMKLLKRDGAPHDVDFHLFSITSTVTFFPLLVDPLNAVLLRIKLLHVSTPSYQFANSLTKDSSPYNLCVIHIKQQESSISLILFDLDTQQV